MGRVAYRVIPAGSFIYGILWQALNFWSDSLVDSVVVCGSDDT